MATKSPQELNKEKKMARLEILRKKGLPNSLKEKQIIEQGLDLRTSFSLGILERKEIKDKFGSQFQLWELLPIAVACSIVTRYMWPGFATYQEFPPFWIFKCAMWLVSLIFVTGLVILSCKVIKAHTSSDYQAKQQAMCQYATTLPQRRK